MAFSTPKSSLAYRAARRAAAWASLQIARNEAFGTGRPSPEDPTSIAFANPRVTFNGDSCAIYRPIQYKNGTGSGEPASSFS